MTPVAGYAPTGSGTRAAAAGDVPWAAVRTAERLLRGAGVAAWTGPDGLLVARGAGHEVRCSVTWRGPLDLPGLRDEYGVQDACGLASVHGRRYGRPTPIGVDYAGAAAAVLTGLGALSALLAGRPRLSTSVAQAALVTVGQYLAAATAEPDDPVPDAGVPAPQAADAMAAPPLTSSDGCRFELEALTAEAWRGFWSHLGAAGGDIARGWAPFQRRYATAVCALPAALVRLAAARPYRELAAAAAESGADLTPLGRAPDGVDAASGLPWSFSALPDTGCSASALAGLPAGARADRATARNDARSAGASDGPLAGTVVVEVTRRVQGPLATHLLALLGARVIRVEPPGGDPLRGVPPMAGAVSARFHALGHRKEVVEADLATPAGCTAVRELAAGADVFVHSLAPGKDAALGLDAGRLAAARPGLVYARASGWGGERGELPPVGTDFPVQAYSGLAHLVTPPGHPPAPSLMTLTDVLGGMICAQGAVAGLVRARRDGCGVRVDTSLLHAARLLCDPVLRSARREFDAGPPPAPAGPRAVREPHAPHEPFAVLARDPRYAPALHRDGCVLVRAPWDFT